MSETPFEKMLMISPRDISEDTLVQLALLQGCMDLTGHKHSIGSHNWFIDHHGPNGCLLCEMGSEVVHHTLLKEVKRS